VFVGYAVPENVHSVHSSYHHILCWPSHWLLCSRRWSCWNPKHNMYCREFVALIATIYCTWLMPISLTVGTHIEVAWRCSSTGTRHGIYWRWSKIEVFPDFHPNHPTRIHDIVDFAAKHRNAVHEPIPWRMDGCWFRTTSCCSGSHSNRGEF